MFITSIDEVEFNILCGLAPKRVMNAVQTKTSVFAMMDMHVQKVSFRPRLCEIILHIT